MADSNGVDSDFFGTAPPPSSRHPLVANGMGALDGQDDVTIAGANNAPSTHAGATVAGFRGAPEATLTIPGSGAVPANQHNATAAGHKDHSGHGHNHHNHHNPHHHHSHHHRQTLNRQHGTISSRTTSLASDEHHYADDLDRDIPVEGIEGLRARSVHRKTSSNTVGGGHEDRDDRTSPVHESSTNHFDHPSRTSSLVPDSTVLNRSHSVAGTNQRHSSLAPYTPPTEEPQEKGQPPARTSSIKSSVAVVPARSSSKLDTTAASAEVSPVANVAKEYPYFKDHLEPRRPSSLLGHVSAYVKSLPLIPTSVSQPIAHAITFLDDLPHGALPRVVGALLVLFLFSPKLFYAMALLLVGVFVGLFAATPAKEAQVETGPATIHRLVSDMELLSFDTTEAKEMVDATQALLVPAAVDAELTQFLSLFIRDFIDAWYDPFNVSKSPEFPAAVHAAMRQALITLGFAAAHMKLVSAVSSLSQTLIDHMREYRAYESSSLSLDSYLSRHPASPFHRYSDTAQINHLLRKLSAHIVLSSVPKADRESPVVFSFLREILATSVLLPMVDKFSDPDYLNQSLVDYIEYEIKRKEEEGVAGNSISASGDGGDDSGETMDGSGASATSTPTPPAATPKQHIVKSASSDLSGDQLLIKVVEARRVPIAGSSGTLYCSVQFGRHTLRTRKVPMEAHPAWVEDFQFDWKKPATADEGVTVNIYEAKILRAKQIYKVVVSR
ncbi:PXA domain-containing protein [Zopfochytrium polystomum]|nr:PXA domain-containing protein [Zopfochytrium polystomum]